MGASARGCLTEQRGSPVADRNSEPSLICRVQGRLCALRLQHVIETLRPLPVEPVAGAPHVVRGLSVIRGMPMPVVDAARLFGEINSQPGRFVVLAVNEGRVALAVDSVIGVRAVPKASLHALPPLLHEAQDDVVEGIGLLDSELLLVLRSARLMASDAWTGEAPSAVESESPRPVEETR